LPLGLAARSSGAASRCTRMVRTLFGRSTWWRPGGRGAGRPDARPFGARTDRGCQGSCAGLSSSASSRRGRHDRATASPSTLIALLLLLGLVFWTSVASAAGGELVVLIAPNGSPPELREALHRVRGELTVHGFSIRTVTTSTVPSIRELEATADREGAVASVVLIGSSMPSPSDEPAPP